MILRRYFGRRKHGFYVDIGAHHPKRFSNTFHFYKRGWNGINIDADMKFFKHRRLRDINVEAVITPNKVEGMIAVYKYQEPALNTTNYIRVKELENEGIKPIKEQFVSASNIEPILKKYSAPQHIDFLNIDVEGNDYGILTSFPFNKYRPEIILIESWDGNKKIEKFMTENWYKLLAKTLNTEIYVSIKALDAIKKLQSPKKEFLLYQDRGTD